MCEPPQARHDRCGRISSCAARATRPPYPDTADSGPARGSTCAFRSRLAWIATRRAHPEPLVLRARRTSPATPCRGPVMDGTCVCCHRRIAIAARRERSVPLAQSGRLSLLRSAQACLGRHRILQPPARHGRGETSPPRAAHAMSLPWPSGGPVSGDKCACRCWRIAIGARRRTGEGKLVQSRRSWRRAVEGKLENRRGS